MASGWLPYWMTSPGRPDGVNSAVQNADLFADMLGEITVSHLGVSGGIQPEVRRVQTGLLGADYVIDNSDLSVAETVARVRRIVSD